mmetsp:Transcript_16461/g.49015  ORF Transcript_16461/g.49015 Transcript_16461/m.49015 type:complete len:202 (-) Transcript_16461:289-894(-)
MLDYSSAEYWEERYLREPGTFDWYQGWHGLRRLLEAHVPKDAHILQVGVGTSKLQEDMVTLGGYESVTNIDVSTVAIEHMRELHRGIPQLRYEVADACDLEAFPDASFGAVLDKGTMDALACGPHSSERCAAMVEECARVLRPLGVMVVVTYGDPISRLAHFLSPEYRMWEDIEVYVLSKPPQVVDPTGRQVTFEGLGTLS